METEKIVWYFNPNSYPNYPVPALVKNETPKQWKLVTGYLDRPDFNYERTVNKAEDRVFDTLEKALAAYEKFIEAKIAGLNNSIEFYKKERAEVLTKTEKFKTKTETTPGYSGGYEE